MRLQKRLLPLVCTILLLFSSIILPVATSCKDIVITPSATAGDYSLLLKVRDPSRDGLQVLCHVPQGTQYTYHHPWTGRPWDFTITHTFFGVTTQGDTLPNIVKAGMVLTDAGLAFADADTGSNWKNPTKNAWDDFDWMRYAYQTANSEDEAITLLTTDAIDHLHATGVTENLFIVGPNKAVVIEADAVHYTIREIPDILIMSNYPKDLWRTQLFKSLPIASSYDAKKETWARQGNIIRLESICGVKITKTAQFSVTVKAVPTFAFRSYGEAGEVTIHLGERATVGPYSVKLLDINGNTVKVSVCTTSYAWEQELLTHIRPLTGYITLEDMMSWARLHASDLNGLRPLCEDVNVYEASMIFRIPQDHANLLSSGWFAANHACSSIYVPVHICDNDLYDPYQTGEAATLSLELLHYYGHGTLTPLCQSVESVFLAQNEENEHIAHQMIHNATDITLFLTTMDHGMQEQAYLTEQLWRISPNASQTIIKDLWKENYTTSLQNMEKAVVTLHTIPRTADMITAIETIAQSICTARINAAHALEIPCPQAEQDFTTAQLCFSVGEHAKGFTLLQHAFHSIHFS